MKIIKKIFKSDPEETYWLTRFLYLRALGIIYFFVFLPISHQFKSLLGENGLLPISNFLSSYENYYGTISKAFWMLPSVFWFNSSDQFALNMADLGMIISLFVIFGFVNSIMLFVLWVLQMSFIHVGQTFWSFGWETNLLEITFLSIFMVPFWKIKPFEKTVPPSKIIMVLHRWVLFRLMFGAGLIKLRGDTCWRELTCLNYHFETQPIPNPLSSLFHFLPEAFLKGSVLLNHLVEIILPWFLLLPHRGRAFTGVIFLFFQFSIIITGNYAWINYLTLVMIIPCFDDRSLKWVFPKWFHERLEQLRTFRRPHLIRKVLVYALLCLVIFLSYKPVMNLIGPQQAMNRSYDKFHLVNSYGVFGSITRKRHEIIFFGTDAEKIDKNTKWKEYEFPCKPGVITKRPCLRSPYHYRITWQLWFAAMNRYENNPWIVHLAYKLLKGEKEIFTLLETNPFPNRPPKFIKAEHYLYKLKRPWDHSDEWYKRTWIKEYLPPLHLDNPSLKKFIRKKNWKE